MLCPDPSPSTAPIGVFDFPFVVPPSPRQCPDFRDHASHVACCPSRTIHGMYFCCTRDDFERIRRGEDVASDAAAAAAHSHDWAALFVLPLIACILAIALRTYTCARRCAARRRFAKVVGSIPEITVFGVDDECGPDVEAGADPATTSDRASLLDRVRPPPPYDECLPVDEMSFSDEELDDEGLVVSSGRAIRSTPLRPVQWHTVTPMDADAVDV